MYINFIKNTNYKQIYFTNFPYLGAKKSDILEEKLRDD